MMVLCSKYRDRYWGLCSLSISYRFEAVVLHGFELACMSSLLVLLVMASGHLLDWFARAYTGRISFTSSYQVSVYYGSSSKRAKVVTRKSGTR